MASTVRGAIVVTGLGLTTAVAVLLASPFGGNATAPTSMSISGNVISYPPDGGADVNVVSSVRLDTVATTAPGTWLAVAGDSVGTILRVEASGAGGSPIPVSLTSQTLALLAGQRVCTHTPLGNPLLDGGAAVYLRRAPNQTGITLIAHDFGSLVDFVSCWPGVVDAGPVANCLIGDGGVGYVLHNHSEVSWDIQPATEVNCTACVHGGSPSLQRAVIAGGIVSCVPGF